MSEIFAAMKPRHLALGLAATATGLWVLGELKDLLFRPKDLPPFYREFPYVPWLGSIWQFATGPRDFLLRAKEAVGDCFTVQLFGRPMTFMLSAEGNGVFFRAAEDVLDIREAYKCTVVTFGPEVCYDCPQRVMAQQFGFIKTGLADKKFVGYVEEIHAELEDYFAEKWGDSGEKCIFEALSELFTLTSTRCLLGPEMREVWQGKYADAYRDLDHSFIPITFFFPDFPNPMRSKCVAAREMFEEIFQKTAEKRRASGESRDDFLQVLMEAKYKDGRELTMQEITGIMVGTLLGGQHTSNVTGAWAMCHILRDAKWRQAILDEQDSLLDGDRSMNINYDQVRNMPVLDQVLDETLRMHPPFFQLARVALQSFRYKDHTIPAGHFVAISPGAVQRLDEYWPQPEQFDPARFDADKVKEQTRNSWIPFGGGKHQCSGRKFATVSLKVAIAWLLRNYELEYEHPMPADDYTTMVVAPQAPVLVKYRRVKH